MAQKYELDQGFGAGRRLGLIVLSTDETIENEARQVLAGQEVSLLHARIPAHADVTPSTLKLMEKTMPDVARLLPQGMGAIGYACTSGATVIGPARVQALVRESHADVPVTNPITAVAEALKALNVNQIAYVSPYVAAVTAPMRAFLELQGITTVAEASFDQKDDWTVARIDEKSTKDMMLDAVAHVECGAIFASCTNLRTFGVLEQVEAETGVPVVSSNQALIWHMLRLAGIEARGWGPGKLFQI